MESESDVWTETTDEDNPTAMRADGERVRRMANSYTTTNSDTTTSSDTSDDDNSDGGMVYYLRRLPQNVA